MKKIILTSVIVFTIGVLSILNTINSTKTTAGKIAKVAINDRTILATAD